MSKHILVLFFVLGLTGQLLAQGPGQRPGATTSPVATPPGTAAGTAVDNPSARPIQEHDIMFKRTLWRVVNLREKQNRPMFALNHEISKLIIEAVKRGELPVYKDDSLNKPITVAEFQTNLQKQTSLSAEEQEAIEQSRREHNEMEQLRKRQDPNYQVKPFDVSTVSGGAADYLPKEIDKMELKENVVFDKKRSQLKFDIQAISLIVKDVNSGFDRNLGSFAYKDLVKVFRDHPKEAIWYNFQNDAQHKNLADAFDLRLFSSYIRKVSNPMDEDLRSIHGGNIQSILASQRAIEELVEFEDNLWSH